MYNEVWGCTGISSVDLNNSILDVIDFQALEQASLDLEKQRKILCMVCLIHRSISNFFCVFELAIEIFNYFSDLFLHCRIVVCSFGIVPKTVSETHAEVM